MKNPTSPQKNPYKFQVKKGKFILGVLVEYPRNLHFVMGLTF